MYSSAELLNFHQFTFEIAATIQWANGIAQIYITRRNGGIGVKEIEKQNAKENHL